MNDRDRRKQRAARRRQRDAERNDHGHVRLQPDAERRHHVGALDAGAHHPAERGPVQQQPHAEQHDSDDTKQQKPIARE